MDWKKILFPPVWLLAVLTVFCAGALTVVFMKGWDLTIPAYALYALSAYTLTVDVICCVQVLPKKFRQIRATVDENPLGHRYLTDRDFRTRLSISLSLAINLLYVALQGLQWFLFRSWWFVVLGVYYGILSLMRFLLARYLYSYTLGADVTGEWRSSRVCAVILLLVNLSLSAAVLMILYQNRGFEYGGMLIYIMAAYSFYSTISAGVDLIRFRKLGSPILSTVKVVSLSAALVSMLNLETAMFSQFGADMAQSDQDLMIMLTGAGISLFVVALSLRLIVRATKEIRRDPHGTA